MKTAIIGAGAGGRAVLDLLYQGRLAVLDLEIIAVVDRSDEAPGMAFAREHGWRTLTSVHEAMALPGLELVIELTGDEDLLEDIYFLCPPGVRVMDHALARVFWDLEEMDANLREQLRAKTELEARIKEDRTRLQEILDTIPDVVMVTDPEMRVARVNRRFEEVTGCSREDARGRHCYEAFCGSESPEECVEGACPFAQVMETREPVTLVHYGEGSRGRPGYHQITASPVFDDEGRIVRIVETSREITELVMLKRETEEMARRYSQIFEAVHGIITIKDLQGRYQLVNPRAERLVGLSQDQMVGRTAGDIFAPEVARTIDHLDGEVLADAQHHVAEEVHTFDGKEHVLISERFPLTDYKGDMVAVCCVSREVTRERELQQELLQTERLAAVGKLAAGVAHELNNPLTGILTFAEDLLLEADQDDPAREDYEIIVNETMRCRRIVRDLLDFSRQQAPHRLAQDIAPVIQRTVQMVARQASFHDVDIDLDLDEDLPPIEIDARQIQQAVLNLLINARDAMDARGSITVATLGDDGGRTVVVRVEDSGPGIPEDRRARVFEPFFSTKGEQGNGLGLPAVVSVMNQHGGTVELGDAAGGGARFDLRFPAAAAATGA